MKNLQNVEENLTLAESRGHRLSDQGSYNFRCMHCKASGFLDSQLESSPFVVPCPGFVEPSLTTLTDLVVAHDAVRDKQRASLEQIADIFRALALASPEERARFKQGVTEQDWKDMDVIANFTGMFSGITGDITLRRAELGALFHSMIALQDRAIETSFVDVVEVGHGA